MRAWRVLVVCLFVCLVVVPAHGQMVSIGEKMAAPGGAAGDRVTDWVRYSIDGMENVGVRTVEYVPGRRLDLYYPPVWDGDELPVVLFIMGYSTGEIRQRSGVSNIDGKSYISWGQLVAASGMIDRAAASG